MNTNDEMIFCIRGAVAGATWRTRKLSRVATFPCSVFATDLKLGRFPSPSSLTLATLPSMSLIPSAPFTDLYRSIGLGRTRTKSAVNLQLDPSSAQRFVSIRVHSWLQLILRPARVRIQGG